MQQIFSSSFFSVELIFQASEKNLDHGTTFVGDFWMNSMADSVTNFWIHIHTFLIYFPPIGGAQIRKWQGYPNSKRMKGRRRQSKIEETAAKCLPMLPVLTVIYPLFPYLGHFLVPSSCWHVHPQAVKAAVHVLDAAALPSITPRHRQRNGRRNGVAQRRMEDHSAPGHRSLGRSAPRTGTPCLRAQRVHAVILLFTSFFLPPTNHCQSSEL